MIAISLDSLDRQLVPVAEWLGTFALHSTVALLVTWAITRIWRQHALAVQESVLRQALWLPLVSSTLQYLVIGSPWRALFAAPEAERVDVEAWLGILEAAATSTAPVGVAVVEPVTTPWALIVVGVALASTLVGVALLWRAWRRLARVLATRRPETDARILSAAAAMATSLGLRQSPRISRAAGLMTPIAFGFLRPEICLPERARSLDEASLRAMLGHELAHLRRNDPAWMWLAAWIHALFPWQLLIVAVRLQWSRVVELSCDAEAANHTSPTAVARCLVEVAEWLRPESRGAMIALGMAARPSALRERVEAALGASRPPRVSRLMRGCLAAVSLTALTLAAPGLQPQETAVLAGFLDDTGDPRLGGMLTMVEAEYADVVREAEQVQRTLAVFPSPESQALQQELQRRLSALSRLRARILEHTDRINESR